MPNYANSTMHSRVAAATFDCSAGAQRISTTHTIRGLAHYRNIKRNVIVRAKYSQLQRRAKLPTLIAA